MSERTLRDSAQGIAEPKWHAPALPLQEYAVLVPTGISRSAVVTCDSGDLISSDTLPVETFPRKDVLAGQATVAATEPEILAAGLAQVFAPGPGRVIHALPVDRDDAGTGIVLVRSPETESPDGISTVLGLNADALDAILTSARQVIAAYERAILMSTFRCPSPCIVVDRDQRVVFANAMFSELAGIGYEDLAGSRLTDFIHLDKEFETSVPLFPEYDELTTPLFVKTQSLFFVSDVRLSRLTTPCGDRFSYSFADLSTERRKGNSNIQLIQKLSAMMTSEEPPQTILRRLVNALALTLDCDLVCIMKKKDNNEMIATPYTNRRLETLRVNFIQPENEPVLQAYMTHGTPVLCQDVGKACGEQSFFRRVLPISRFAFLPAGQGSQADHALLMAWSRTGSAIGMDALPLLKVVANLLATVLASARQSREIEQEKDKLRRYSATAAGREVKMADLKKENAQLKELVTKLGERARE